MGHSQMLEQQKNDALNFFEKAVNEMKNKDFARAYESFKKTRGQLIEVRYWARLIEDQPLLSQIEIKLRETALNGSYCKRRIEKETSINQ